MHDLKVLCVLHDWKRVGDWHIVGNTQIARDWSRKRVSFTKISFNQRDGESWEVWQIGLKRRPPVLGDVERTVHKWVPMSVCSHFMLKPLRAFWYLLHVWTNMWRFFSCCFNALQTATEIILIMKRKNQKQNNSLSFNQIYYISL